MKRIISFISILTALMVSGCASTTDTVGYCRNSNICPIVVYEKFPGVFVALPERMIIASDKPKNNVTLIWTFADQSKYKFSTRTSSLVDDGVELIDKSGATIGLRPCFITNDSREYALYAAEGVYLRCEITDSTTFKDVRYRVRFHAADGSPRVVDPTMDASGGGDTRDSGGPPIRLTPPSYQTVDVDAGNPVTLPLIGGSDGVKVIWNAGAGKFNERETPMRFKDSGGNDVDFKNCRTTSDAKGDMPDASGRYYMCLITTAAPTIDVTYTAAYRDSSALVTKSSTMKRP